MHMETLVITTDVSSACKFSALFRSACVMFLSTFQTYRNSVCWRYTWQSRIYVHALLSRMSASTGCIRVSLQASFHIRMLFHFLSPELDSAAHWTDESRPAPCPGPRPDAHSSQRRILRWWCSVFPQRFCMRLHAERRNWWHCCERGMEVSSAPGPSLISVQDSLCSRLWCTWSTRSIC